MALRQQVWVDKSVQGVLVGRVILYWVCALMYVGIGSACFQYNQNPEWTITKHAQVLFGQIWPWLPTAILILPLSIYDIVRMSNLFAGPVFRLRKHFAALRNDIACAPLTFREDDYWRDLAAPINDMQAEILRLRSLLIDSQKVVANTSESVTDSNVETPKDAEVTSASVAENAIEIQTSSASVQEISIESESNTEVAVEPPADQGVAIAPLPVRMDGDSPIESAAIVPAN